MPVPRSNDGTSLKPSTPTRKLYLDNDNEEEEYIFTPSRPLCTDDDTDKVEAKLSTSARKRKRRVRFTDVQLSTDNRSASKGRGKEWMAGMPHPSKRKMRTTAVEDNKEGAKD